MQIRRLPLDKGMKERTLVKLYIDYRLPEELQTHILGAVISVIDSIVDGEVFTRKDETYWFLSEAGETKFVYEAMKKELSVRSTK